MSVLLDKRMEDAMRLVKDYMNDTLLRHELNALTEATFCFNFESWVTNGYFEGDYIPYSLEENGKILSNVSVNRMHFIQNGEKRYYLQLGTVMTASDHRKQGLARKLMEHVLEEYDGKCDGIYLFATLSALDLYRKMGFIEGAQYQYTLKEDVRLSAQKKSLEKTQGKGFVKVDPSDAGMKKAYMEAVRNSVVNGALEQENKYGLQMFYTAGLENVYYSEELNCFAVMEENEDAVELQSLISTEYVALEKVICQIPFSYKALTLGFAPRQEERNLFDRHLYLGEEDYRLFYRGRHLESIEQQELYFPVLSHA